MPLWRSRGGGNGSADSGNRVAQYRSDTRSSASTKRSSHCGDDTSRDDHVFERHHAVLVCAQTQQYFAGFHVQHTRNLLFVDEVRWERTSQPPILTRKLLVDKFKSSQLKM